MKIKWGALVTEGRGKAGGTVASRNRTSAYLRNKVSGVNPQSAAQVAIRSLLSSFSEAWRSLSQSARDAWDAAVDDFEKTNIFGDTVKPTGKNLYTGLNVNLSEIGESTLSSPPSPVAIPEPEVTGLTLEAAGGTVEAQVIGLDASVAYKVLATRPLSAGVGFFKNKYRLISIADGAGTSPFDLSADYVAKFGAFSSGQKIAIKFVPVVKSTGQKGIGSAASGVAV